MKILKTIKEIKNLVLKGKVVYCDSMAYQVKYCNIMKEFLIVCKLNNYTTGLHGKKGTINEKKLNGTKFFIID